MGSLTSSIPIETRSLPLTRPYAAEPQGSFLFQVIGEQRDRGTELFAQGDVTPALSVFGGLTYIDPRVLNTGIAATDGGLVVGVPEVKSDITVDLHPKAFRGFAITATAHYESERAATDTNQSFAPQFATLDLGVRYSTKLYDRWVTTRFGAINLTDAR